MSNWKGETGTSLQSAKQVADIAKEMSVPSRRDSSLDPFAAADSTFSANEVYAETSSGEGSSWGRWICTGLAVAAVVGAATVASPVAGLCLVAAAGRLAYSAITDEARTKGVMTCVYKALGIAAATALLPYSFVGAASVGLASEVLLEADDNGAPELRGLTGPHGLLSLTKNPENWILVALLLTMARPLTSVLRKGDVITKNAVRRGVRYIRRARGVKLR